MIKFEDIPLNILRPALEAYAHASGLGILPDDEAGEDWEEDYLNGMQAAIAAALSAWPGARLRTTFWPNDDGVWIVPQHMWSLPLPQENSDE